MTPIIGIDLGTTNSEVAVIKDGKIVVLKVDNSKLVPSVVSLDVEGNVLVGQPAVNNELANPQNTIRWIKRKMGLDELVSLGGESYTPPMISSLILKRLKSAAEDFLQQPIDKAVITVPAFFNEKQRDATQEAAALAGLEAIRLLNEPTAAALAYSLRKKENELCLVYDLGGGTFDVSIVYLTPEMMEVKASHGDTELGGSDFDRLIAEKARQEFQETYGIDLASDPLAWARLMRAAEKAKISLSTEPVAKIAEEFITKKEGVPLHLEYTCLRTDFEEMISPYLERTLTSVRTAMEQAEITPQDIDRVILVGGATYTPLISQLLEKELQIVPQAWIDPSTVVARGAAIEAANLSGQTLGPLMVDITPHSLGIACLDMYSQLYHHILIPRNSPIPYTASKVFYKVHSEQDTVEVEVYQGESRQLTQNQFLGKFKLEGLRESPGMAIHIKFHLDRSGLLHVTASDALLGKKAERSLKKAEKICKKNVPLADLETVRIYHQPIPQEETSPEEEDWEQVSEESALLEPLSLDNSALFGRVEKLLNSQTLNTLDQEELTRELAAAKSGEKEAVERLSNLLYYLE